MQHYRLALIFWLAAAFTLPVTPAQADRDAALEQLLLERDSPDAFAAAIETARNAGISEQGILEARFLFHVDRGEYAKIAALKPEFLKRREIFNIEESEIFATEEDWLAVTEYVQALDALQKNDAASFKKHITEAFWLSPGQGAAFAPHIEKARLAEAMKEVRVDFNTRLVTLHQGEAIPISKINTDAPATLLHFWSPWSRECEATLPDFTATAVELAKHGIAVISILPEQSPEVREDALEMIKPLGANPPGAWLLDRARLPLAGTLRVRNLPAMVLLDPDGAVLFNGHPADAALWKALATVAPEMARPEPAAHE
ncbi:MAG: TlpA family protein disulfide reductase [Luteolibacter sp.]|jgi:hypothetical protein